MMHFSIPDTAEHIDASGGSFTVSEIIYTKRQM